MFAHIDLISHFHADLPCWAVKLRHDGHPWQPHKHVIIQPYIGWGHVRPFAQLAAQLLRSHPDLLITVHCHESLQAKIWSELVLGGVEKTVQGGPANGPDNVSIGSRIQTITFSVEGENPEPSRVADQGLLAMVEGWRDFLTANLAALFECKGTVHGQPNKFSDTAPSSLIYDLFLANVPAIYSSLKDLHHGKTTLLGFFPTTTTFMLNYFVTTVLRQRANPPPPDFKILQLPDEVLVGIMTAKEKAPRDIPGFGKRYDYESSPMIRITPVPADLWRLVIQCVGATTSGILDAIITTGDIVRYEEQIPLCEETLNLKMITAGPQFPDFVWNGKTSSIQARSENERHALQFLDSMSELKGPRSVAYIGLGTAWFPHKRPELINYLLSSLNTAGIPWLYTYASADWETVPKDILDLAAAAKGNACLVNFAPQWDVLNHAATRVFVTHCGSNSIGEAVLAQIPMVTLPFQADQPDLAWTVKAKGCAIPLDQMKCFLKPEFTMLHDGTEVIGTEDAILQELEGIWATVLQDNQYSTLKASVSKLRGSLVEARGSGWIKEAVNSIGAFL